MIHHFANFENNMHLAMIAAVLSSLWSWFSDLEVPRVSVDNSGYKLGYGLQMILCDTRNRI